MKTIIKVKGMTCGGCRQAVEKALKLVPGVACAEVSLEKAEALVEHDPAKASTGDLAAAIEKAGFAAG